jgi:hypothetical protein
VELERIEPFSEGKVKYVTYWYVKRWSWITAVDEKREKAQEHFLVVLKGEQ